LRENRALNTANGAAERHWGVFI